MSKLEKKQLGEILSLEYGKALRSEERSENGRYPVYGSNGIVGSYNEAVVKHPTIVVGRKGAIGEAHLALDGCWPIDTAFYTVLRKPDAVLLPFLLQWFRSVDLKALAITSTIPGLNRNTLYAQTIPLPPLPEQERIVKLLDEADALRKLRSQADKRSAELIPALFNEMFGDIQRDSKKWPKKTVASVCNLVRGSSPRPKSDPRYYGGPVPRLMIEDITRDGWQVTPRIDSLTTLGATKSRPVKSGTIVMAVSGNVGLCAQLQVDACIHDGFIAFNGLDGLLFDTVFFGFVMSHKRDENRRNQAGAVFQNITTSDVKSLEIPVPPLPLQKEFASRVSEIRAMESGQSSSRQSLDALFQSMLHRAFQGEL